MNYGPTLSQQLAAQLAKAARVAGQGCDFPKCKHVTLGFHCKDCGRKLCNDHLYYTLEDGVRQGPKAICPSCIVDRHAEMFEDEK